MKKYISILLLTFFCLSAWTQDYNQELNRYRERMRVEVNSLEDVYLLSRVEIDIDRCSFSKPTDVYVYATPEEANLIRFMGFKVTPAPVEIGPDTKAYAYYTYETLTTELKALAAKYPQIATLESIGASVQGRELWVMKISDHVDTDEAEPEVKYISTMHGDEVVGQELLMHLIRLLLENYGKDTRISTLVNELEIWIMPNMNPDGTAAKRRYNADWVDLNRNFPDPQSNSTNDPSGRALEVQHMMKFTAAHHFTLSLNFHGGAVCVNYLWDTMAGDVPDINVVKSLALGYSERNPPMYKSTSFKNGITNGYAWYEVNNGMQDWNYHWFNDMDFTVELSNSKWPSADLIPQYWEENRESLLWFMAQARKGVFGIVTDSVTGKPVQAKVEVSGIGKAVFSSARNGDYQKVLLPGSYTFKFTADGYDTATFQTVKVLESEGPTVLNVSMSPTRK